MPKQRQIETRTKKIRALTAKAHAAARDHKTERPRLSKTIADINAEIHILLREIEELASTVG